MLLIIYKRSHFLRQTLLIRDFSLLKLHTLWAIILKTMQNYNKKLNISKCFIVKKITTILLNDVNQRNEIKKQTNTLNYTIPIQ